MASNTKSAKLGGVSGGLPVQTANTPAFDYTDFEGRSAGSSIFVPDGKTVRLPDQPCRYAMLAHWNILDNAGFSYRTVSGDSLYENSGAELYYGFGRVLIAQLYPSQTTQLLPINNLNQISVRSRPGTQATLFFAWFW